MRPLTHHVLVTGGAGFIGSRLVARLLREGRRVTVLDDLSSGRRDRLPEHPDLEVVVGSVLDPGAIERAAAGADLVLHLAGIVGMRLTTARQEAAYRVAAEGTRLLLERSGEVPVVLFSSSAIYGLEPGEIADEAEPIPEATALDYDGGSRGYAAGKWELERLGRAAAGRGRPVVVVRPFNVVGAGQPGAYGMVLPTFIARALAGEPLQVYDDGRQCRTFAEVETFAACIWRLLGRGDLFAEPGRVLNVGSTEPTRIAELARLVLAETGAAVAIEHLPYRDVFPGRRDVRRRVPAVDRLHALVGPVDWPPVRDVVRAVVRHHRGERRPDPVAVAGGLGESVPSPPWGRGLG